MPNLFVLTASVYCNVGAFLTGLYIAGFNGILEMEGFQQTFSDNYRDDNQLLNGTTNTTQGQTCNSGSGSGSDTIIGLTVSISNFGSIIGSLLAGWLADQISRKYGLLVGGLTNSLGLLLMAASFHIWVVIIGRGISGIGVGIIYMIMPVYVSEFSPKESRGSLGSLIGLTFSIGSIAMFCLNLLFSKFLLGWRISLVAQMLCYLSFSIGTKWMPHTPRWLILKQRKQEALLVLSKINHDSKKEMFVDTYLELEELKSRQNISASKSSIRELFTNYKYRLMLACALYFFEAAAGNSLLYFSSSLFCQVGVSPFVSAIIASVTFLCGTILSTLTIDRLGRKMILLSGGFISVLLTGCTGTLLLLYGTNNEVISYSALTLICVFLLFYTMSWLVIPWIVSSEIFPTNIRGTTVAICTGLYWLFATIWNQITPLLLGSAIQSHGYFYVLAGISACAFLFVLIFLPETKGVSLEKMDELFSQGLCKRLNIFQSMRPTTTNTLEDCSESKKSPDNKENDDLF